MTKVYILISGKADVNDSDITEKEILDEWEDFGNKLQTIFNKLKSIF